MKIKVFILIKEEKVDVYPNLTQLVKNNPAISYFKAFRALQKTPRVLCDGYVIAVAQIRWKTRRRLPRTPE